MPEILKALSLHQPWAWAVVHGYKDVENRSWSTTHRGPLLIHASKRLDPEGFQFLWELGLHRVLPDDLPRGRLVGSVRVVDVVRRYPSEWAFRGAYQWVLRSPREFRTPPPLPRGAEAVHSERQPERTRAKAQRQAITRRMKPKVRRCL